MSTIVQKTQKRLSFETRLLIRGILLSLLKFVVTLVLPLISLFYYPSANSLVVLFISITACTLYMLFPTNKRLSGFIKTILVLIHGTFLVTINTIYHNKRFELPEIIICTLFLVIWILKERNLYLKIQKYKEIKKKRKEYKQEIWISKPETIILPQQSYESFMEDNSYHHRKSQIFSDDYIYPEEEKENIKNKKNPTGKKVLQIEEFIQPLQIKIPEPEDD